MAKSDVQLVKKNILGKEDVWSTAESNVNLAKGKVWTKWSCNHLNLSGPNNLRQISWAQRPADSFPVNRAVEPAPRLCQRNDQSPNPWWVLVPIFKSLKGMKLISSWLLLILCSVFSVFTANVNRSNPDWVGHLTSTSCQSVSGKNTL